MTFFLHHGKEVNGIFDRKESSVSDDHQAPERPAPKTAEDVRDAIKTIMGEQLLIESNSPYDRSVCVKAVATASDTFERISVTGSGREYMSRVYDALEKLQEIYADTDGEYTNGKAPIGGVLDRLYALEKLIKG